MEDRDLILINLVKQYPHLYDRNNSGFKDKILVENSWKGIGFALKTSGKFSFEFFVLKLYL